MALPSALLLSPSPQELTFIAEEELIEIVPSFSMSPVRLISGVYGPFQPPAKAVVPLWLALSLKRKKKCRIIGPEWLTVENLEALVQAEKENPDTFVPLPRHYIEVSKVLLDIASTDLASPSDLHSLLLSLRHIRLAKIRTGLRPSNPSLPSAAGAANQGGPDTGPFSAGGEYLKLTGLTPIEIVEMRSFLGGVMGMMKSLTDKQDDNARDMDED